MHPTPEHDDTSIMLRTTLDRPPATAAPGTGTRLAADEQDELVRAHLSLVSVAVNQLAGRLPRHVCRDDLRSAAMFGLAQAARTFDPAVGVPFTRYAMLRIRGALLDELRDEDWATRSVRALARRADSKTDELTVTLGRTPTTSELAVALDVAPDILRNNAADRARATVLRIEAMPVEGSADALLPADDSSAPELQVLAGEDRALLRTAIDHLPERLRAVIVASFLEERTLRDIADDLGVTESRVSQMRTEALDWLREGMAALSGEPVTARATSVGGRAARRRDAYQSALRAK